MAAPRRPRILTIDNGGLQAISLQRMLKDVCIELSKAQGESETLAPYQLFDIIAGIGTGGWLAILLGRYRLRIDQCVAIYMRIANAIDPTRTAPETMKSRNNPAAISRERLIERIDMVIEESGISPYMIDSKHPDDTAMDDTPCYAFAVGVVEKSSRTDPNQKYRLFRSYARPEGSPNSDPAKSQLKVSAACAATAAAKDFMKVYKIGDTSYWDEDFPETHNVSGLALDEAKALFKGQQPQMVVSLSPGIPTGPEIDTLKQLARRNGSTTFKLKDSFSRAARRTLSEPKPQTNNPELMAIFETQAKQEPSKSEPTLQPVVSITRSDTSSTQASIKERGHQESIKKRLKDDFNLEDAYFRLELVSPANMPSKPYLNDVASPQRALKLTEAYLMLPSSQAILAAIRARAEGRPDAEISRIIINRPHCATPEPISSERLYTNIATADHAEVHLGDNMTAQAGNNSSKGNLSSNTAQAIHPSQPNLKSPSLSSSQDTTEIKPRWRRHISARNWLARSESEPRNFTPTVSSRLVS